MKAEIKGNTLVIHMELFTKPRLSSKRKSMLVASSGGAQPLENGNTPIMIDGKQVVFSGNAYYDARH